MASCKVPAGSLDTLKISVTPHVQRWCMWHHDKRMVIGINWTYCVCSETKNRWQLSNNRTVKWFIVIIYYHHCCNIGNRCIIMVMTKNNQWVSWNYIIITIWYEWLGMVSVILFLLLAASLSSFIILLLLCLLHDVFSRLLLQQEHQLELYVSCWWCFVSCLLLIISCLHHTSWDVFQNFPVVENWVEIYIWKLARFNCIGIWTVALQTHLVSNVFVSRSCHCTHIFCCCHHCSLPFFPCIVSPFTNAVDCFVPPASSILLVRLSSSWASGFNQTMTVYPLFVLCWCLEITQILSTAHC